MASVRGRRLGARQKQVSSGGASGVIVQGVRKSQGLPWLSRISPVGVKASVVGRWRSAGMCRVWPDQSGVPSRFQHLWLAGLNSVGLSVDAVT